MLETCSLWVAINLPWKNNLNEWSKHLQWQKISLNMTKNVMFDGKLSTFGKYVISP
jgi:hypothetical protein